MATIKTNAYSLPLVGELVVVIGSRQQAMQWAETTPFVLDDAEFDQFSCAKLFTLDGCIYILWIDEPKIHYLVHELVHLSWEWAKITEIDYTLPKHEMQAYFVDTMLNTILNDEELKVKWKK